METDIEIAQKAAMRPVIELAGERFGVRPEQMEPVGHYKAKMSLDLLRRPDDRPGKLILVTAVTPTPAGEGKTTTTVGDSPTPSIFSAKTPPPPCANPRSAPCSA